ASITYSFFFQAEDGIRDYKVTGVQTCALPISTSESQPPEGGPRGEVAPEPSSPPSEPSPPGEQPPENGAPKPSNKHWYVVKVQRSEERRVGKECRSRWAP